MNNNYLGKKIAEFHQEIVPLRQRKVFIQLKMAQKFPIQKFSRILNFFENL
jgi:hypothetical protein